MKIIEEIIAVKTAAEDIKICKTYKLHSVGDDKTSYQGNQLGRVISYPKKIEQWQQP